MTEAVVVDIQGVTFQYGKTSALEGIDLQVYQGQTIGLIGPDGVGKSTLLSLVAGARKLQQGKVCVLGADMRESEQRTRVCSDIAYMPQGLGKNLYATLSVQENLQFFGRLFGHDEHEILDRIHKLTRATGLEKFLSRPAGKLSGGMKQKLGLCCALIHDPRLLILDEPTTGVDPLARSQFWALIDSLKQQNPIMTVMVATAYMDEASGFDRLIAMDDGKILATGTLSELLQKTGKGNLDEAFIALLPEEKRARHKPVIVPPLADQGAEQEIAIEADGLTMRFGDFVAVDRVSFKIRKGEIFGFLGSNGCGKSTTMKMLTGLLAPSEGKAWLFGQEVNAADIATRARVGYMSQSFSLYGELTVMQNLVLHARLFSVQEHEIKSRVQEVLERFDLESVAQRLPHTLPLGIRQRLSLAVAMVHRPEMLILDEPTSGVDPIARDDFWRLMIDLARNDKVTIFISTHFMNEALRCDRMSLMHAGKVLITDTPEQIMARSGCDNLDDAFIKQIQLADKGAAAMGPQGDSEMAQGKLVQDKDTKSVGGFSWFSFRRLWSYTRRESLELQRDPMRATMALLGSLLLMLIMGYGINMDVEDLRFAVLDRDESTISHNYANSLSGSRYFIEMPALSSHEEIDQRMASGELALAFEIPPGFGRDLLAGRPVRVAAYVDGAMPQRAENVLGYVSGMHLNWLEQFARDRLGKVPPTSAAVLEPRFRYNPDVRSLPAMVPAVIPLLLLVIPAMLAALSVVREKELGSIINLYVTPVNRVEFLIGKQLPYIALGMLNFLLMFLLAIWVFDVPLKGSFTTLFIACLVFVTFATGFGLFASSWMRSQVAAIFITLIGTLLPSMQFSGLLTPVTSLEGLGRVIGEIFPATYMFIISRGAFAKALGMSELWLSIVSVMAAVPVVMLMAIFSLRKQEK